MTFAWNGICISVLVVLYAKIRKTHPVHDRLAVE